MARISTKTIIIEDLGQARTRPEVAILVCLNGQNRGWCFILTEDKNCIGTQADCEIVVYDPTISSRHANLRRDSSDWVLSDLDSRNGTCLLYTSPSPRDS